MNSSKDNRDTKQDEDIDGSLDALYQKRKGRHSAPNAVRQEVLNKLASNTQVNAPWWKINFKPYMQISAVAGSVAVAFIVISLQLVNKQPSLASLDTAKPMMLESTNPMMLDSANAANFQTVELHILAPKSESFSTQQLSRKSASHERMVQYQSAQDGYLAKRQANVKIHQQSFATIVNDKEGLSLLTCEQNLLKLSQEVVDLLMSGKEKNALDLSNGQMVALAFDRNGHIIDIRREKSRTEC